jgi:hypothetical protein
MDPEDLREIISSYQKCVAETVQRFAGYVAKYMGDGVLVYFGYPQAHEDDAERAVRAGLELIAAVSAFKPRRRVRAPRPAIPEAVASELRVSLARMKVPEPKDDEVVVRVTRRPSIRRTSACCSGFGVTTDLIAFTDRSAVC